MKLPGHRIVPTALILSLLILASGASAQVIVPVNGAGTGTFTFDQPSAVAYDSRAHVAFIGNAAGDNTFKLYYAAVSANAPFTDSSATQSDIVTTPAVAIDNGAGYRSARHPRIGYLDDGRLVVVFQAIPAAATDNNYKLFRALITLSNHAVVSQVVDEVVAPGDVELAGNLVDPAFQYSNADKTLRIVYSDASTSYRNVYFLRAGVDNAIVAGGPLLLSSLPGTLGVQPLPRLSLDSSGHSHVVWAANDNSGNPTGIYYSMVMRNSSGTPDNVGIGPTQVIYGNYVWGYPDVFADATSSIYILAADQSSAASYAPGPVAFTRVDPSDVRKDGNPVNTGNLRDYTSFFADFPGGMVLSGTFDVYHPEMMKDDGDNIHVAGYGYASPDNNYHGSPGRYYAMDMNDLVNYTGKALPDLVQHPASIGSGYIAYGMQMEGDYTRPAFAYFGSRAIHFWSGPDASTAGASNIYVTYTEDFDDNSKGSGCSVPGGPRSGRGGEFPWEAAVLLPAVFLLLRKTARKGLGRR